MIDTHVHLWDRKFEGDLDAVMERAQAVGVSKMICLGCDEQSSRQSLELAVQYEGRVFAALGTHPSDVAKFSDQTITNYRDLIGDHLMQVKAIGEIGLDYHYPNVDRTLQQSVFKDMLGLARSVSKPVVVHCRDVEGKGEAYEDCLAILDDSGIDQVVYHCFAGSVEYAGKLLERGFMLSFTGVITYPNAAAMREVVAMCPLERLMVETDCPYLAPQAYRGQRNEPAYVVEVVRRVAEIKGLSIEEVALVTNDNAVRFFGL